MNVPVRHQVIRLDPVAVFELRAWARATLWQACIYDLPEAVDPLQDFAVASGLGDRLGQDEVQRLLADAFHRVRSS
jgi:hypothetical protein